MNDGSTTGTGTEVVSRLFFALWPTPSLRMQMAQIASMLAGQRGRPVPIENLHLTLAFLGNLPPVVRTCAESSVATDRLSGFTVVFDRLGYWARSSIVWLAPTVEPPGLSALVDALRRVAFGCGLRTDTRPYRAHLTLMRRAHRAPRVRSIPPLAWPVTDFCLVESRLGAEAARYSVVRKWDLANPAP